MTIEELKQALEAATPGPWTFESNRVGSHDAIYAANEDCVGSTAQQEDARLIVEAVNSLPKLLKVAEAAQTMLDAIDKGAVDSEQIVPVPGDGPPYRFHEEWAHHTRKALEELNNE